MLGKELNQLQLIPEIVADDLIAVYDTSDTINAEKLKKITYESLTNTLVDEVITSVSGLTNVHNDLSSLQGGTSSGTGEYYHLTSTEYLALPTYATESYVNTTLSGYVTWDFGSETISGTGDVYFGDVYFNDAYCNDIHTSSGTVYLGDLKLSSADGEELLINDEAIPYPPFPIGPGSPTTEPGAPGGQSLEISVIRDLNVNLYPDGAGGGIATVTAADFIRMVRCYSGEIPNLLYGLRRDGGAFPPTLYADPFDAKITLNCSDPLPLGVKVYIQHSNDEVEVDAAVYIYDYLGACP